MLSVKFVNSKKDIVAEFEVDEDSTLVYISDDGTVRTGTDTDLRVNVGKLSSAQLRDTAEINGLDAFNIAYMNLSALRNLRPIGTWASSDSWLSELKSLELPRSATPFRLSHLTGFACASKQEAQRMRTSVEIHNGLVGATMALSSFQLPSFVLLWSVKRCYLVCAWSNRGGTGCSNGCTRLLTEKG
jgi:hypothetical protein